MKISIVRMGSPQLDIDRVITIINNNQNMYVAEFLTSIPNIGRSDLDRYAYSDNLLFEKLNPHIEQQSLTLGITSVQLENNWWIRPNNDRSGMIITTYEADSLIERTKRTIEDFVVFKIITCVIASEFFRRSGESPKEKLIHEDCRGCLFDFCPDKQSRELGLQMLFIDNQCRGILLQGNVPEENIMSIESVMKYMKKPSLSKSVYSVERNPILTAIFGIGIGVMVSTLASFLFTTGNLKISILLILFFTLGPVAGKYIYDLVSWKRY